MWQTVGHDKALRTLDRAIAGDRVAHAYLIVGPAQVGKTTLALDLARAVNCTSNDPPCGECRQCQRIASGLHPDVRVVGLEPARSGRMRTQIGIDQVRDVQREASLLPYEGRHRVFIFETAEKLTAEASNSLLKMLEEPPDGVIIVLLASDAGAMLPTILSRCRRIDLRPVAAQTISDFLSERYDMSGERAQEIAGASSGRFGWAVEAARDSGLLDRVRQTIDTIDGFTRGSLTDRFDYAQQLAGRFSANREDRIRRPRPLAVMVARHSDDWPSTGASWCPTWPNGSLWRRYRRSSRSRTRRRPSPPCAAPPSCWSAMCRPDLRSKT